MVIALRRHDVGIESTVVTWFYITIVNRRRIFLGYFCSSKRSKTRVYFITFTLHDVYPQHGGGRTQHGQYLLNDATVLIRYVWWRKRPRVRGFGQRWPSRCRSAYVRLRSLIHRCMRRSSAAGSALIKLHNPDFSFASPLVCSQRLLPSYVYRSPTSGGAAICALSLENY